MRAFIAVVPPRSARDQVELVRDPLRELAPNGRWVHPSLWHMTLKFLGEVEDELVPAVADLCAQVAGEFESFPMTMQGLGFFPNADRPKVLWVGATKGAERFEELAGALDVGLDGLGFEPEERSQTSHLTLARFREPFESRPLLGNLGTGDPIVTFEVDEIVLMKSVLRPRGPDYTVVEKLALVAREKTPEELAAEAAAAEAAAEAAAARAAAGEEDGGEGSEEE